MIKEEDVLLSKMSYTDKDFASIYPDLLDLAKQLTDKWDPSLSNESDPGVVLLKEGAFIADHNNYNIDKNVLENFLPSATQESSVRNLLELNGYTPEYYISAEGEVSLTYNSSEELENFVGFSLPAFTLVITNDDNSVFYTQVSNLSVKEQGIANTVLFMEGTLQSLTVNSSATILLENLDDNNRVYFPVKQVAENGIFIKNIKTSTQESTDYWEKKNYIATQPLNSKVYKVGFDSSLGVPYVEFPSDIANIIGNGITIDYIVTSGNYGNVKANTLTSISTPTSIKISDDLTVLAEEFSITNNKSIMNGKDPETINEMYRSFKKVVGTFETLVTCKDYSNAIYSAKLGTNKLVSNAAVTDRNNDYNNSFKIVTYDQWGEYFELASKLQSIPGFSLKAIKPSQPALGDIIFEGGEFKMCVNADPENIIWTKVTHLGYSDFMSTVEAMTPYDLCIYALKAFSISDYLSSAPAKAIEKSFTPIVKETYDTILNSVLEEYKCINHNFLDSKDGDVLCFKNYVPLNITIVPYSKVTKQEKEEIIDNIYRALSEHFNASQVDFGDELYYEEVLKVLLNSDDRIKNIRLEDFDYTPKALVKDSTEEVGYKEYPLYDIYGSDGYKILLDVVAKNVLAGRLCLFDFDDEFEYKYGQIETKRYNNIASVRTEVEIKANENDEVSYSNIKESKFKIYSRYSGIPTKICITGSAEGEAGRVPIPSGETYTLLSNEILYVDRGGVVKEYYSDSFEHELTIENNTSTDIYIEYSGKERKGWLELTDGYICLISILANEDAKDYDLNNYKPKENEYIEIAYNNYTTDAIFPTYIKYRYVGGDIDADTDHILEAGESILLSFTENGTQKVKSYGPGEVIRPNFNLIATDSDSIKGITQTIDDYASAKYTTLTASQQIEHRQLMETILNTAKVPCYWIVNNNTNTLFYDASATQARTNEIILSSGEYFVYSNANKDSMVILGPGTLLRRSESDDNNWTITNRTTYKDISDNGFDASIEWRNQDFSGDKTFTHQEMNIITLCEGDTLSISNWGSTKELVITNEWVECTGDISYTLATGGQEVVLSKLPLGEYYLIRSRLDMALNNSEGQRLYEGQKFVVTYEGGYEESIVGSDEAKVYLQSSAELSLFGDKEINISDYTSDTAVLDFNMYKAEKPYLYVDDYEAKFVGYIDATVQYYKIENSIYTEIAKSYVEQLIGQGITDFTTLYETYPDTLWYVYNGETETALDETNGKYIISLYNPGRAEFKFGYNCEFSELSNATKEYILPVFLNYGKANVTAKIEDLNGKVEVKIQDYNIGSPSNTLILDNSEMYLLKVCVTPPEIGGGEIEKTDVVKINTNMMLTLSWNTVPEEPEILNVHNQVVVNGGNTGFGSNITLSDVIGRINELIKNSTNPKVKPYYIYRPEHSIAIQNPDIEDPNVFWDKNNIINNLIIPQVDIRTMADKNEPTVDIIKSMRNY